MVGDHVAERAGCIVERSARSDLDRLGGGDLDMIDIAIVPHRFEPLVGEARDQDVLDSFLSQEVWIGVQKEPR
ncbi:hypothetical protein SSCI18S_04876 [Sphingobium scionense]